jgi:hypothetical protein
MLQKSPNRLCEIEICNDRIGARAFLNRCCAFAPDLESMLRDKMLKILLQQYRHQAAVLECPLRRRLERTFVENAAFGPIAELGHLVLLWVVSPAAALKREARLWRRPTATSPSIK